MSHGASVSGFEVGDEVFGEVGAVATACEPNATLGVCERFNGGVEVVL